MTTLPQAKTIVGKTLVSANYTYRGGDEHVTLGFEDPETGEVVRLSITAELGSDLWLTLRRVPTKKTRKR